MLNQAFLKELSALEKTNKTAVWAVVRSDQAWRVNSNDAKHKQVKEQLCELAVLVDTIKRDPAYHAIRDWSSNPDPAHAAGNAKSFGYLFKKKINGVDCYRVVPVRDIVGQESDLVAWWADTALRDTLESRRKMKIEVARVDAQAEVENIKKKIEANIREMTDNLVDGLGEKLIIKPDVSMTFESKDTADKKDVEIQVIFSDPKCDITLSYEQYQQMLEVLMRYKDLTELGLVA
jgi:hypothetical protein